MNITAFFSCVEVSFLYSYIGFFESWPNFFHAMSGKTGKDVTDDIFHAVSGKSLENNNILNSLRSKTPIRLSWTHYRIILQETTADGRIWYENEAAKEMWSTRTLQRNVSSQYYHRLLQSQDKAVVRNEMKELTSVLNSNDQLYAAKYLTYMPTQDELRREIEQQKEFFRLQNT